MCLIFAFILLGSVSNVALAQNQASFSGGNAYQTVKELTQIGPRQCAGPGEKTAFASMKTKIESYGIATTMWDFSYDEVKTAPFQQPEGYLSQYWFGYPKGTSSVLLFGDAGDKAPIIIGAHIDSLRTTVGANDNATGSAVLVELARVTHALGKKGFVFALLGCEEVGLLGSYYMANTMPVTPAAMISVDMVGFRGNSRVFYLDSFNESLENSLGSVIKMKKAEYKSNYQKEWPNLGTSDHFSFALKGVPAVSLNWQETDCPSDVPKDWCGVPMWKIYEPMHSPQDTLDKVDQAALQGIGDVLSAWIILVDPNLIKPGPVPTKPIGWHEAKPLVPNAKAPSAPPPTGQNQTGPTGTGQYMVVAGDTLAGIGRKYNTDYLTIAKMNGIAPPYTIFIGQTLKVPK